MNGMLAGFACVNFLETRILARRLGRLCLPCASFTPHECYMGEQGMKCMPQKAMACAWAQHPQKGTVGSLPMPGAAYEGQNLGNLCKFKKNILSAELQARGPAYAVGLGAP